MDSNENQEQMCEGISKIRGDLNKGIVGPLNNKIC